MQTIEKHGQYLRAKAVKAHRAATGLVKQKDYHGAATNWGAFYALVEAYAALTEQPLDMVTEVIESEAEEG